MRAPHSTDLPGPHQGVFQPHLLVQALNHDLDRKVLHCPDGRVLSAGEVRDEVSRYVQAIAALGLGPGTRIGILSGNRPEVLHISHAAMLGQCVLTALHPLGSLDDHLYMIEDSGLDALVYDPIAFDERAREIGARLPGLRRYALGDGDDATNLVALASAQVAEPLHAPNLRGDEVVRLSYSGGTTGRPKAIVGTHASFATMTQILLGEWEWPQEIRMLLCAPLSHSGAPLFLPTLVRGGSMVVLPSFDPVNVLEAIQRHRITCTLLVPTMIYALLDHPRFSEFDLSSLETIFYGASPMSPARLREGIEKLGPVFFQFYGQAEAPMSVSVLRRAEHDPNDEQRMRSCGRPVPQVHVALLDEEMSEVRDGQPGEICVRGPLVMPGYFEKPEMTAEALRGGWLHTGDVAVRDAKGFLHIVDRKKDMIISGGFNVYPREIEDVLGQHEAVAQCAVIGVPDSKWGEAVKAIVVLRSGVRACSEELIALVRDKKGSVQAPKTVDIVDAIPLTAVGKPDKKALRARYAQCGSAT